MEYEEARKAKETGEIVGVFISGFKVDAIITEVYQSLCYFGHSVPCCKAILDLDCQDEAILPMSKFYKK